MAALDTIFTMFTGSAFHSGRILLLSSQNELDINCDFSSNNNIWARFYGGHFMVAILNLVGLFLL